jgi:hypothetical protein
MPSSEMSGGRVIGEAGGIGDVRIEVGVKGYGGSREGVEGMLRLGWAI